MTFCCWVRNASSNSWCFTVENPNWNSLREKAEKELAKRVSTDSLHRRFGPWTIYRIDVAAE